MGRYHFRLATPEDDAALREVLAATPMDGRIAVRFLREPSFFAAAAVEGPFRQTAVCVDTATDRIVGFGTRSARERYVNGSPAQVGYLSTLRAMPAVRGRLLLAGAYQFLKELHADGRVDFYLSTIAEGNTPAIRALTSGRAGLPAYAYRGQFHTAALPVPRRAVRAPAPPAGIDIRPAEAGDAAEIVAFLNRAGPAYPYFPVYTEADFFRAGGTFRDLPPARIMLAFRAGRLIGTLAGWDQHAFKQTQVAGYTGALRWLRPAYNGWARLRDRPRLPAPGEPFHYAMGALPVVEDDDPAVFGALLDRLLAALGGTGTAYLLIGLHATHPLWPVLARRAAVRYSARLYHVAWDTAVLPRADERPPYLELGCL